MRILIVEDEVNLATTLKKILKQQKYIIDISNDGESGLDNILSNVYDLVILDIMLPKIDGITILKKVRQSSIETPIILLTAKGEVNDKVLGLDCGADDYLVKPFDANELLARIRAISRRKSYDIFNNDLNFGDFSLLCDTLILIKEDKDILLSPKEKELLELLINRNTTTTPKDLIINKVWGYDSDAEHNNVEVYISFLRKKLKYINSDVKIKTIRGIGYILEKTDV